MFLVIAFTAVGGQVVFAGKSSELLVGFLIGVSAMMTELFFVLMVFFFTLGEQAATIQASKYIPTSFRLSAIIWNFDSLS